MKGIVTPINRSAKARDTMNLWKRCRRNLVDFRITVTSTVFDKMMMHAVMSLKIVFGEVNNAESSSGSHSNTVNVSEVSFSLALSMRSPSISILFAFPRKFITQI